MPKLPLKNTVQELPRAGHIGRYPVHSFGYKKKYFSSVTGRPLDRPVFDELGKLYNKDSVIELLLDKKRAEMNAQAEEKSKKKKVGTIK